MTNNILDALDILQEAISNLTEDLEDQRLKLTPYSGMWQYIGEQLWHADRMAEVAHQINNLVIDLEAMHKAGFEAFIKKNPWYNN